MFDELAAGFRKPETGVDRVLFEAAWKNERLINYFRFGFCLAMGIPAELSGLQRYQTVFTPALGLLAWALCAVAFMFVLRRVYHPAFAWMFSTLDVGLFVGGLFFLYQDLTHKGEHAEAARALGGLGLNALFVTGVNLVRFSWPVAVWTAAFSFSVYLALTSSVQGLSRSNIFEGILFAGFAGLLVIGARRLKEVVVRVKERDAFARFLSAPAVERVVRNPSQLNLGGEEQEVTIIFTDVRNFTARSAAMKPEQVVAMLNTYFAQMVDELFVHGGTLDKFIGDGLVAVFAPPLTIQEQAKRALLCAAGMLDRLEQVNASRRALGETDLAIGIGIHSGPVVAGNIGTSARMEYTHIGDAVNTCSRIEALTKELGVAILASEVTVRRAGELSELRTVALPPVTVKGKTEPLLVFSVERQAPRP